MPVTKPRYPNMCRFAVFVLAMISAVSTPIQAIRMIFLDYLLEIEHYRNYYLQLYPDFDPRLALNEPTRTMVHVFIFNSFQLQNMRPIGTIGPHGKDLFMTFDREQYRAHISPLKLTKQQEDDLLTELWNIAETLVDQSFSSPAYPLQLVIACEAFDAVEQAIAGKLQTEPTKEEELCR